MKSQHVEKIAAIKAEISTGRNPLDCLKGAFGGESALVVSAGPSAAHWKSVFDDIPCGNPVVCCVKQAVDLDELSTLCHMHFLNSYNLKRYNYKNDHILSIFSSSGHSPPAFQRAEVEYFIERRDCSNLTETLAARRNFDDWLITNSGNVRPWGPGIMYESVLYTLIHCGVSDIYTVGWDISNSLGQNAHFYDRGTTDERAMRIARMLERSSWFKNSANYFRYLIGKNYNKATMYPGEAELVASSLSHLKEWFRTKGVGLHIYSNSDWMNTCPRI